MGLYNTPINWNYLAKLKSSLMKAPSLTGNNITASQTFKKRDCCPGENVLMNNGGVTLTHPNPNGSLTGCDCTT